MGEYARDLLLSQFYFETIFPRIPKPVEIDIEKKMRELGVSTHARGNGGQGGPSRRGGADGGRSRPTSVKAALSVGIGNRGPHKSYQHHDDRDRRRSGRGRGTDRYDRDYDHGGRDSTRDRERSRERNRGGDNVDDTHGVRGTSDVFHDRFTAGASKSNLDNIRQRYG
jgi:pre-mRNA-splicing factor 38B